jgi:hypothetical protein
MRVVCCLVISLADTPKTSGDDVSQTLNNQTQYALAPCIHNHSIATSTTNLRCSKHRGALPNRWIQSVITVSQLKHHRPYRSSLPCLNYVIALRKARGFKGHHIWIHTARYFRSFMKKFGCSLHSKCIQGLTHQPIWQLTSIQTDHTKIHTYNTTNGKHHKEQ